MELEDELIFKRFPAEKQEQVRQMVAYAQLMGLTGKDLVSIGGKLDRMSAIQERKRNLEIIHGFSILPIGRDKEYKGSRLEDALDNRFKIKTAAGAYNFFYDYGGYNVKSATTGKSVRYNPKGEYHLGNINWCRRVRYAMILDVAHGYLQLNF
jgi:hypothetical protein